MVRIAAKDFEKLIALLKKEALDKAILTFKISGTWLQITTTDKQLKEMLIEIGDVDYQMMPRITKTETF